MAWIHPRVDWEDRLDPETFQHQGPSEEARPGTCLCEEPTPSRIHLCRPRQGSRVLIRARLKSTGASTGMTRSIGLKAGFQPEVAEQWAEVCGAQACSARRSTSLTTRSSSSASCLSIGFSISTASDVKVSASDR